MKGHLINNVEHATYNDEHEKMSKFWSSGSDSDSSSDALVVGKDDNWSEVEDNEKPKIGGDDNQDEFLGLDPNATWAAIEGAQVFLDPPCTSETPSKPEDYVRIVCISDTHGKHNDVRLPAGDILIHGGDFTKSGEIGNIISLSTYFLESGFDEICCIAGNHDMTLHPEFYEENSARFHNKPFDCGSAREALKHCVYLEDSSYTSRCGIEIYGSPWSPEFFNWAFNLQRGPEIRRLWEKIPESTDILISHTPPLGRGDLTKHNGRAGCYDLLEAIKQVKPRVNVFGHIHEGAGVSFDGHTLYINASNLNISYQAIHRPVVVDLPLDKSKPAMVVQPRCDFDVRSFSDWCKSNGFNELSRQLSACKDICEFPTGDALLERGAYRKLCDKLQLNRDEKGSHELNLALSELFVQSFPK